MVTRKQEGISEGWLTRLINSNLFYWDEVFIYRGENNPAGAFHLVLIHGGIIVAEYYYKSFRGAKIAFTRMNRDKPANDGIKPHWSHWYHPIGDWVEKRLGLPRKGNRINDRGKNPGQVQ